MTTVQAGAVSADASLRADLEEVRRIVLQGLGTLREALAEPKTAIVRDAAIQRFEYSFETTWKAAQRHLRDAEGWIPARPRA